MPKDREAVTLNGKAAFYASIYDDLKNAASKCGWALGLHGSLNNDMDIMAMPWTEDAKPVEEMIQALSDCFTENPFKDLHVVPNYNKPNNRVVYTMAIWKDYYLDINVIDCNKSKKERLYCQYCINEEMIFEGVVSGLRPETPYFYRCPKCKNIRYTDIRG